MIYLVDTVQVDRDQADRYVELVADDAVPVMTDAGADLVACWTTAKDLGEDVEVKVIWAFADFVAWNEIRKNLVLDTRYPAYTARAASLRKGGDRQFYHPASFSPSLSASRSRSQ